MKTRKSTRYMTNMMKTREFTRYMTDKPVYIAIDHVIGKHQLYLCNVSRAGLSFNAHGCIAPDTELDIRISSSVLSYAGKAKVVWCKPQDTGLCQQGVMFAEQIPQSDIENIIHKH